MLAEFQETSDEEDRADRCVRESMLFVRVIARVWTVCVLEGEAGLSLHDLLAVISSAWQATSRGEQTVERGNETACGFL